ncbi:unnamed protein product [marine sediment metagenome]|uniref:Uncharacterized protein n=1 Tax=marine sediment metagenome TaxID=412755 RepID=X1T4E9_9ZZZZ
MAGIHPHEDGIRIVSKYIDGVEHELGYPPVVVVQLSKVKESKLTTLRQLGY